MDGKGKVIGEARQYDPYSGFGHIMLYEIDVFGYVPGYVSKGIRLMSEEDLRSDERLRKALEDAQYDCWKRHNIVDLIAEYKRMFKDRDYFERFCKVAYESILNKKKRNNETIR